MKTLKFKYFMLGGVLSGPLIAILLLSLRGLVDKPDADYMAIENAAKSVSCPDGAAMVYAPWGESGWMGKCQLAHGPFIAAERGRIVIKSEYSMGKLINEAAAR